MSNEINITQIINKSQKMEIAKIYYRAFVKKFSALWLFVNKEDQAIPILYESINYKNGLYAVLDSKVIGFVGLETGKRFFTQLRFSVLLNSMNIFSASWRYLAYRFYRLFHGKTKEDAVHIDPIVVSEEARGLGVGTRLLEATAEYARMLKKSKVVLEVVDTNPRAKKLYEKMGFKVVRVDNTSILTNTAGFKKLYHMEKTILQCF